MVTITETIPTLPEIFPSDVPREVTTEDVLNWAADWLVENDFCQGHVGDIGAGTACVWSVSNYASIKLTGAVLSTHRADEIEHRFQTLTGQLPASYNDAPGRTKEEVIQVLREAAERA